LGRRWREERLGAILGFADLVGRRETVGVLLGGAVALSVFGVDELGCRLLPYSAPVLSVLLDRHYEIFVARVRAAVGICIVVFLT
jgi:hypothetical protein